MTFAILCLKSIISCQSQLLHPAGLINNLQGDNVQLPGEEHAACSRLSSAPFEMCSIFVGIASIRIVCTLWEVVHALLVSWFYWPSDIKAFIVRELSSYHLEGQQWPSHSFCHLPIPPLCKKIQRVSSGKCWAVCLG